MPEAEPLGYTIRDAVENFLMDRRVRGCGSNTLRYYRDELRQLELYTGPVDMGMVNADCLRSFFLAMEAKRNRGGIHSLYRSVHVFLRWFAAEMGGEYDDPTGRIAVKAPKHRPLPGVPVEDIQRMVDACTGPLATRDATMLRVLLDTGLRSFEFVALNLGDVNLITGAVYVMRGKGDQERTVYMGQASRRAVRKYLKPRTHLNPAAPLWLTDEGARLSKRGLREVVERRAAQARVHCPGLHDFRRAFALNMHRAGVDILTISRLLGHRSLEMTKRYIARDDNDLRAGHARGSPVDNAGL